MSTTPDIQAQLKALGASPTPTQVQLMGQKDTMKHYIRVSGLLVVILKLRRLQPTMEMMLQPKEKEDMINRYIELLTNYCKKLMDGKPLAQSNMKIINEIHSIVYKKGA